MDNIKKRIILFLGVCVLTRLAFVFIAKYVKPDYLPYLGLLALLPAIGFISIYLGDHRKTGREVFGGKIWWNDLRPIHSILYLLFSYFAITKNNNSWYVLLIDVIIGSLAFLNHHKLI